MFVDELTIHAKAGNGGAGVVRWLHEKWKPKAGPAGGNGGDGGDVYLTAVRDVNILSKYSGSKEFRAKNGQDGRGRSQHGKDGDDIYIKVPTGAKVTDLARNRGYIFNKEGDVQKILKGGSGGLGNEYFKSSTNRTPRQCTKGTEGEEGDFLIELSLFVDAGLVGLPNAGKSTLLNTLTNARAKVGSYPFTTLEPHLGELHGVIFADIPGLIEGAAEGRGLGHKFLRHIERTNMLLHCVSLENEDVEQAHTTVREELERYNRELTQKEEWIVLTKSDLTAKEHVQSATIPLLAHTAQVFVVSAETGEGIKELQNALTQRFQALRTTVGGG